MPTQFREFKRGTLQPGVQDRHSPKSSRSAIHSYERSRYLTMGLLITVLHLLRNMRMDLESGDISLIILSASRELRLILHPSLDRAVTLFTDNLSAHHLHRLLPNTAACTPTALPSVPALLTSKAM